MTLLRSGAASDVGRRRSVNQDAVLTTPTLFVVADGMGGHAAGDIAATMAVATFEAAGERLRLGERLETDGRRILLRLTVVDPVDLGCLKDNLGTDLARAEGRSGVG